MFVFDKIPRRKCTKTVVKADFEQTEKETCYNVYEKDGTLVNVCRGKKYKFCGNDIVCSRLWSYNGWLCYVYEGTLVCVYGNGLNMELRYNVGKVQGASHNNTLYLAMPSYGLVKVDEGELTDIDTAPQFSYVAVVGNRLIGLTDNSNKVWYSGINDMTDWTVDLGKAGYVELDDKGGNCIAVVNVKDNAYVVRENAITKITFDSNEENFAVKNIIGDLGTVCAETVCTDGVGVYLQTDKGTYYVTDNKTVQLFDGYKHFVFGSNAVATFNHGKYYLACKYNFGGTPVGAENGNYVNNALFVYDKVTGKSYVMRGVDVRFVTVSNDKTVLCDDYENAIDIDNDGNFYNELTCRYELPQFGKDSQKCKLCDSIVINTSKNAMVTVKTESDTVIVNVTGKPFAQKIKLRQKGKVFNVSVQSTGSCNVSYFAVNYCTYGGVAR